DAARHGDTLQALQKINMEERPPELAVRNALKADGLLFAHDVTNRGVLNGAQLFFRDLVSFETGACVLELLRSEQAADVVGAKWRVEPWHGGDLLGAGCILHVFAENPRRSPPHPALQTSAVRRTTRSTSARAAAT